MTDKVEGAPGSPPVVPADQEITEVAQDGILVGFHVIVQCEACRERGVETALELNVSNPDMLEVSGDAHKALWKDPMVVCPACSAIAGVPCVIPISVYVGQDAEDADTGLELLESEVLGTAPDDGAPFAGVETTENPFQPVRDEDNVKLPPIEDQ